MELVTEIYKLTDEYPKNEEFGLKSQSRRAAVSIPSNIAEGSRRSTDKDFRHFLLTAYGSGAELETQIEIAKRLQMAGDASFKKTDILLEETMKMLNKFIQTLTR